MAITVSTHQGSVVYKPDLIEAADLCSESVDLTLPIGTTKETILQEAAALTSVDRQRHYGHPRDNFKMIASMWSAMLGVPVTERMVGRMMVVTKMARDCNLPKRDNLVDAAGYARTMEMLDETP